MEVVTLVTIAESGRKKARTQLIKTIDFCLLQPSYFLFPYKRVILPLPCRDITGHSMVSDPELQFSAALE